MDYSRPPANPGDLPLPHYEVHEEDQSDELVGALRAINSEFGIPLGSSVVYPGSATDTNVAHVYGKDNVEHVDPAAGACEALLAHGYRATAERIEDHIPEKPYDLLVALNSYGRLDQAALERLIRPGGHAIVNNHTEWAHDLSAMGELLELIGAIVPNYARGQLHTGSDIPVNVAGIEMKYYTYAPGAGLRRGTPEQHTFAEMAPKYPDGLFVFRRKEVKAS